MHKLFFLIGSSGSGKTTVAELIEDMKLSSLAVCRSDSLPVPSRAAMIKECGSVEEWQRANTTKWVKNIKEQYLNNSNVLFDLQSRPTFIEEACKNIGIEFYTIILFDCSDEERKRRLVEDRQQADLANQQMMDWARYLRENCFKHNCQIINNTQLTPAQSLAKLLEIINSVEIC